MTSLFLQSWDSFLNTKTCPTCSGENVGTTLWKCCLHRYYLKSPVFLFKICSFYKLSIISDVPALIYLKGLFESRVAEAPIQYSQRSPSLEISALVPFRRQSFFDCVNQSLQKDSLTIKSALRVQRLHSTPILQASRSTNLLKGKSITVSIWSKQI